MLFRKIASPKLTVLTLFLAGSLAAGLAALAPPGAAAAPALRTSPRGDLTVITANVEEYLSVLDNGDGRDLTNFARRVKQVLTDEAARGTPAYVPDLIFVQEVDRATVQVLRRALDTALGQHYEVAGSTGYQPAPGRGAHVSLRTTKHALVTRATAVLYNTATMSAPSATHMITFSYPKSQMYTKTQCPKTTSRCQANMWESRQSAMFRITAKRTGRAYAVTSVHFEPYAFLRPTLSKGQLAGFREGRWLTALHERLNRYFPGLTQVIGGDFNEYLCVSRGKAFGASGCQSTAQYTPLTQAALSAALTPVVDTAIDHVFTSAQVLGWGKDTTYQLPAATPGDYGPVVSRPSQYLDARDWATRFTSSTAFTLCEAAYNLAQENRSWATALQGCGSRFYSDHPLDWAVIR